MLNELFFKLFRKKAQIYVLFPFFRVWTPSFWFPLLCSFFLFATSVYSQNCGCTECPVAVPPDNIDTVAIDVNGAIKNSLADSSQGVCGVLLNFKSPYIWGNRILLISPAGQIVTLTGPVVNRLSSTGFSQWNISFTRSSFAAAPDQGFSDRWTNNQDWAGLNTYAGTYYPSQGKLENFNTGTVDGRWTLIFSNQSKFYADTLLGASLIFCDNSGIGCNNKKCRKNNDVYKTICGGSFQMGDKIYGSSGVFRDTSIGAFGCDSVTTLYLTVNAKPVSEISATICESDSFSFNGVYLNRAGKYERVIPGAVNKCDSLIYLTLKVISAGRQTIQASICEGESFWVGKNQYTHSGIFTPALKTSTGCDSLIELHLKVIPKTSKYFKDSICRGQIYKIGNFSHQTPGVYSDTLQSVSGCDSVVHLELSIRNCTIGTSLISRDVDCAGGENGVLYLSAWGTAAPYRYTWLNKTTRLKGGGVIIKENGTDTARGLQPGKYSVDIDDALGNRQSLSSSIGEPKPLEAKVSRLSGSGSFNLPCADSKTGYAEIELSGGVAPYNISWDAQPNNPILKNAGVGIHKATISDARGCRTQQEALLTAPAPLHCQIDLRPVVCFGDKNAAVAISHTQGGIPPYNYSLNGVPAFSTPLFAGLKAGAYKLQVKDSAGCIIDSVINVSNPSRKTMDLGGYREVAIGDSFALKAVTNVPENDIRRIIWTPDISGGCVRCEEFILKPLHTEFYKAVVIDGDGCSASDSVKVEVKGQVPVFVPNVFAPEGREVNSRLTIFATPAVQEINTFKIFDRWGDQLFEKNHFLPNNTFDGWDGTRQGQIMESGVYIWLVEYQLIDGSRQTFGGDVTLIR